MADPTQWELTAEHEAAQAVVDEIDQAEEDALIEELRAAVPRELPKRRRKGQSGDPTK